MQNFKRKLTANYGDTFNISCSSFHDLKSQVYLTLTTSSGKTENIYTGSKDVDAIETNVFDYDGGICGVRSSVLWRVVADEKHDGGTFGCCRTSPPECVKSIKLAVNLSNKKPKVKLCPAAPKQDEEVTALCMLYFSKGKEIYWVLEWSTGNLSLKINDKGSLYKQEYDQSGGFQWRLRVSGGPGPSQISRFGV
ncbi:hypothetical protein PoB_006621300 [Plakobranchus ocellatus]|uniref:Uncharacterized protein n=1 Tax=Plakobranchus ocellatus TaxID=259542 RepID=A0AAV4D6D3_9GAST|nr:hypothetical protein PoB_006621300 [Plakobranchus ocellatus]